MILAFAVALKDSSLTLNTVFSLGFSSVGSSEAAVVSAAGAAAAAGMAISWIFSLDFNAVTKSAACSNVRPAISSTSRVIVGLGEAEGLVDEDGKGGGGDVDEEEVGVVAVLIHLEEDTALEGKGTFRDTTLQRTVQRLVITKYTEEGFWFVCTVVGKVLFLAFRY